MLNYGTSRSKCFKDLNAKTALKYDKLSLKSAHRLNASEICTLGNSFYIRERVKGLGTSVFLGSISPTVYRQILCTQIPKAQKDTDDLTVFLCF